MTQLKDARPAIRELVRLLKFRSTFGRPCYIKRTPGHAALIVPHLRDGADGPYSLLRVFQRNTLYEAEVLGFIVLGSLVRVPAFEAPEDHWAAQSEHFGRTVALRAAPGEA